MPPTDSHDEFLELCAVATAGGLTEKERQRLQEHLAGCASCRQAMRQYGAVAHAASAAAGPESLPADLDPGPSWSQERAESRFLERLAQQEEEQGTKAPTDGRPGEPLDSQSPNLFMPLGHDTIWRHVWLQYAAAILLIFALGVCVYRIGVHRGTQEVSGAGASVTPAHPPLEEQVSDAAHERELLRAQTEQRDKTIAELRRQMSEQSADISRMKETQARLEADVRDRTGGRERLAQERAQLAQQLEAAQASAEGLHANLDSLTRKSSQDSTRAANLEAKVAELTKMLRDRDETIDQQQELLAHDRDIRELMGARDLYIAEVYDVARTGATQKPYGRVFYTKGKSLIFYAYDLDQQKGVKNTNATFQAWGRRGADWQQALNLGILYEDNAAKKRWILKSNDPKALAQIDAVFVTVEPKGGSQRPSSKPFLFAYLRIDANHP